MKIQTKSIFIKGLIGIVCNVIFFTIFFTIPHISKAETHIKLEDVRLGATWNKESSPYILDESVYVENGYSLNIGKGVTIMSASSTYGYEFYDPSTIYVYGNLNIDGTKEEPVSILDLKYIYFARANTNINYTVLNNTGIDIVLSTSTIDNTIIKNSNKAIHARASQIDIKNSKLINNRIGISSDSYGPFLMYGNNKSSGIGGIGNALEDMLENIVDPSQNIIKIHNSSITGNSEYGILQQSVNTIDATDNWWGSENGPYISENGRDSDEIGDTVEGVINVTPWLIKDPDAINVCCSSVLFIPGIEASRLYRDESGILGTSTNTLWEPNRNEDVRKMYLDENGKSIDTSIYTSDVIDKVSVPIFGINLQSIYKSFIAMMNSVVADGSIKEWLPFPYDWRNSVEDVVNKSTQLGTSTISLIETIENMARRSKTGKAIIVAHSNGGLVAKELTKILEEKGEGNIVEKIIFVAVPELGTPQAIISMLHGDGQSILSGTILTQNNARTFSQNMPGAYGLLPSKKFFERNPINVISDMFGNDTGIFHSTYESMKDFILNNPFSKLLSTNTNEPLLLNSSLLNNSEDIHSVLDTWKPGSTTKTLSLLGWGIPTGEGVKYDRDKHCDSRVEECKISYTPVTTERGDGTVVIDSSSGTSDTSLFVNLKKIKDDLYTSIKHADILESVDLLNVIKDQVSNAVQVTDYGKYITTTEPIDTDKNMIIRIFSPVDIHIYDKDGRHTGPLPNPIPGAEGEYYEESVPGTFYRNSAGRKTVYLTYGKDYHIELKGTEPGVFAASVEIEQFDKIIASTTFADMPVTTLMNAEMIIPISTENLISSSTINIDFDGDNMTDFITHTDEFLGTTTKAIIADYSTYIESIRKVLLSLNLTKKEENKWIDRINKIDKELDKRHVRKAQKYIKKLEMKSSRKNKKNETMTIEQKSAILVLFDRLLSRIENNVSIKNIRPETEGVGKKTQ